MSSYDFSSRPYATEDFGLVTSLIREDLKLFFDQTAEGWSEEKLASIDVSNVEILECGSSPVGLINREVSDMFGGGVYFRNIHVHGSYRGKGMGRFGVECANDYAIQVGLDIMFGKVFVQNPYLSWLERQGFNIVEDIPEENSVWVLREV